MFGDLTSPEVTCVVPAGEAMVGHVVLEAAARSFLTEQEQLFSRQCTRTISASWNFQTNVTAHNMAVLVGYRDILGRSQES